MARRKDHDASRELMRQLKALGVLPSEMVDQPPGVFRRHERRTVEETDGRAEVAASAARARRGAEGVYSVPPEMKAWFCYGDPETGQMTAVKGRWEYVDLAGNRGEYWEWTMADGTTGSREPGLSLYRTERLKEISRDEGIHLVDGEEGVAALEALGMHAMCAPDGAASPWEREWTDLLRNRTVRIWAGKEGAGRGRMLEAADALWGRCRDVRVMEIPGLSDGRGMVRYLQDGKTAEQLEARVAETVPWLPKEFLTERTVRTRAVPAVRWIVEGLLPEGACVLAGKPKMGKSLFALNLAQCIAHGTPALGGLPVDGGDVLYLALEDGQSLLKERLAQLMPETEGSTRLHFRLQCPPLHQGGMETISQWVLAHRQCRMVVIDTWEWVRPRIQAGSAYGKDHAGMKHLQTVATAAHIAIVVVHHLRKQGAADPLDEINASTGLAAAANGSLIMKRVRGTNEAVLHAIHRSAPQRDYGLRFEPETCLWTVEGTLEEVMRSGSRRQVLEVLQEYGPLLPVEMAEMLGWKRATVRSLLSRMAKSGEVIEGVDGYVVG